MTRDLLRDREDKVLMRPDVTAVPALGDTLAGVRLLGIRRAVRIHLVRTVVLVVALAVLALQTRPDLRAHADAVAHFDCLDGLPDADCVPDDFVPDGQGGGVGAPSVKFVDVAAADAARVDFDIDVGGLEGLGGELLQERDEFSRGHVGGWGLGGEK